MSEMKQGCPAQRFRSSTGPGSPKSLALLAGLAAGLIWVIAAGAAGQEADRSARLRATLATQPAPGYARTEPVPRSLLTGDRRKVILLPSEPGQPGQSQEDLSGGTYQKVEGGVPLLPEGYSVAARPAAFSQRDQWLVATLGSMKGLPDARPMKLLPNSELAILEAILSGTGGPPVLALTGRVTEFYGENYLLIENLEDVTPVPAQPAVVEERELPATAETTVDEAGEASEAEEGDTTEPTAEEIMKQLLERQARRSVVLPATLPEVEAPPSPETALSAARGQTQTSARGWTEGDMVADRVGRFIAGESWWTFAFEDQGKNPTLQPMRLLPNRLLEAAIMQSRGGTRAAVFKVSGEVKVYKGTTYLLLRKVLLRRDLGNLR